MDPRVALWWAYLNALSFMVFVVPAYTEMAILKECRIWPIDQWHPSKVPKEA